MAASTGYSWQSTTTLAVASSPSPQTSDTDFGAELETENARLKKLVANQALDIDMLGEISEGNF